MRLGAALGDVVARSHEVRGGAPKARTFCVGPPCYAGYVSHRAYPSIARSSEQRRGLWALAGATFFRMERGDAMSPVLINHQNRHVGDPGSCLLQLAAVQAPKKLGPAYCNARERHIRFVFTIVDHPGWTGPRSANLYLRSADWRGPMTQVLTALNAGVPVPDGPVDLERFVGQRMRATVKATGAGYFSVIPETAQPGEP
jgi:hypothetical protein